MYINDLFNISKVLELIFGGLSNSDDDSVKNFQNVHISSIIKSMHMVLPSSHEL